MGKISVWTKQHEIVLSRLEQTGRYTARKESILKNEDSQLLKPSYDWLARHMPQENRPADADYPIWLSLHAENTMLLSPSTVILELELDEALLTKINVAKWGTINNFSYIPANEEDFRRHNELLNSYGVSDTKACMSQFYPVLKREIEDSWDRLFDDAIQVGSAFCYGLIWEVKREWIQKILR